MESSIFVDNKKMLATDGQGKAVCCDFIIPNLRLKGSWMLQIATLGLMRSLDACFRWKGRQGAGSNS
jgi:hypothetical protein